MPFFSTPSRIRTHTLTSVVLCAIHYTIGAFVFVSPLGFEPRTPTLKVWCSNQLSYEPLCAPDGVRTHDPHIKSVVLSTN